jgi:hypothetical protein
MKASTNFSQPLLYSMLALALLGWMVLASSAEFSFLTRPSTARLTQVRRGEGARHSAAQDTAGARHSVPQAVQPADDLAKSAVASAEAPRVELPQTGQSEVQRAPSPT